MLIKPVKELPPRARRIQAFCFLAPSRIGTTSACAENTASDCFKASLIRNYLRVRGEYDYRALPFRDNAELPPRARRIRASIMPSIRAVGTTSACAENTSGHGKSLSA